MVHFSKSKISSHSHTHDLLKEKGDTIKKIDPTKIEYKPLTISNLSEVKNLHKEWFPIDYDDDYFKKIFINRHSSYFTIGAFYNFEIKQDNNVIKKEEIIIGMALCEFRGVSKYFVNHTSRAAVKEICDNIDFNEGKLTTNGGEQLILTIDGTEIPSEYVPRNTTPIPCLMDYVWKQGSPLNQYCPILYETDAKGSYRIR